MGQIIMTNASFSMPDSWLSEANPLTNYGTSTFMTLGRVGSKSGDTSAHFCINCPTDDATTGVPSGATITAVKLRYYSLTASAAVQGAILSPLTETWTESGVDYVSWTKRTFGTNWSTSGGTYSTIGETAFSLTTVAGEWVEIDCKTMFLNAKPSTLKMVARLAAWTSGTRLNTIHSGENATNKPEIVITYTLPSSNVGRPNTLRPYQLGRPNLTRPSCERPGG